MIGRVERKWVGKSVQLPILSNFRDLRTPTVHQALESAVDGPSGLLGKHNEQSSPLPLLLVSKGRRPIKSCKRWAAPRSAALCAQSRSLLELLRAEFREKAGSQIEHDFAPVFTT